jgi:hypothetical protein
VALGCHLSRVAQTSPFMSASQSVASPSRTPGVHEKRISTLLAKEQVFPQHAIGFPYSGACENQMVLRLLAGFYHNTRIDLPSAAS